MSDDNGSSTALSPSEEAFFESGGTTDPGVSDGQGGGTDEGQQQDNGQNDGQADPNAQQQAPKPEKTVPLAALHQARMELRDARAKSDKLEQTFQRFMQMQGQQQQPQIPNRDDDPITHFDLRTAQLEQQLAKLAETNQQAAQQSEQQRHEQHFVQTVNSVEAQFAAQNPDYPQATKFLQQNLIDGFINQGYSQQEAVAGMQQQIRGMINNFFQLGLNPAEMGYSIAKARGFKSQAAANPNAANGAKIAQLNKGQQAARTLSTAGGAGKAAITLESLAEMDPDELEKNWDQVKKFM